MSSSAQKTVLKGLDLAELETWVSDELGAKPYRARQLYRWMYHRQASAFEEMTDISVDMRQRLESSASLQALEVAQVHAAADGTRKLVFRVPRTGGHIEAVYIPTERRVTLCISSQVGCALGCEFCFTATLGLLANLTAGEIVDQVVWARRLFGEEPRISNIVYMGMGEPLHNYDSVVASVRLLTDDKGLNFSHRKVTVSTVGMVPAIRKLGREDVDLGLAVSLNATTDAVRSKLMPINRKYDIDTLLGALREFPLPKRRRITIEYVLLAGVNDTDEDARRLIRLLHGLPCKVNLIPFNPHAGSEFKRPDSERVSAFQGVLLAAHVNCLIRETRGDDKMAACGQLGGSAVQDAK